MAVPSEEALEALAKLSSDPRNLVYIISGRDQAFLEHHFGHFKNLGMSAEHGGFMREPGHDHWTNFTESLDMDWMGEVHEIFKYYTEVSSEDWMRPAINFYLTADHGESYRVEKELDYVALPSH